MSKNRKLLGPLEAVNGVIMLGMTSAALSCTARGFWDTGLNPMPPRQPIEAASDGTLLA